MIGKKETAATILRVTGGNRVLRALPAWNGLLVVNYHRIGDVAATPLDRDLFSASADGFRNQMQLLAKGCDVISPSDLDHVRAKKRGRYAIVTFDDGYRDNFGLAFPALRDLGLPGTFFIATSFIDQPRLPWWDEIAWLVRNTPVAEIPAGEWFPEPLALGDQRDNAIRAVLSVYKKLPAEQTPILMAYLRAHCAVTPPEELARSLWMNWDDIRAMHAAGMTIGAHTVNHQLLGRLSADEQAREIRGSRDRISEEIGAVPTAFAYPIGKPGSFTDATKALLMAHGFLHAFEFNGGYQPFSPFDQFAIRRTHIGHQMSLDAFAALASFPVAFAR